MKRLVFVAAALVSVLVAGELVARCVFPIGGLTVEPDERMLFRPRSNGASVLFPEGRGFVVTRVNDDGLRGPAVGPKRDEISRVVVYGDSLVHAADTPMASTFPEQLERQLRGPLAENGRSVEVLNAGVGGYGPDQALLLFESHVDELRPDLVVLVVCVQNDVRDVLRNDLFELGEDGALIERPRALPPELADRHADLARNASRLALVRIAAWLSDGAPRTDVGTRHTPAELARRRPRGHRRFDEDARALMGELLARFRDGAQEHGARFALLLVPSSFDLSPEFVQGLDPSTVDPYDRRASSDAFVALAEALDVPCLDLFEPMQSRGAHELFLAGNFHWTAEGQAFAAAQFAELAGAELARADELVAERD